MLFFLAIAQILRPEKEQIAPEAVIKKQALPKYFEKTKYWKSRGYVVV